MKIAVLFGSFNPLTNAHIAAMKTAVEHLNADKGLFVATNGQYLKRKAVKIDDAFYLTEDERQEIIEKVCLSEPGLEFWGFEMGGINPKRYKTLAKIQKQNPDAEIYEIQGADKVCSISKFGDAQEYISNIKFAVFERDGIDLQHLIDADELLSQYKSSFVILPALEDKAEISSTEVRWRFNAGEDYSDIVPTAAVDVMSRYKPSDFSISFAEKMQTIMKSSRFGENNARKIIYSENTKLFNQWKDGNDEMKFGEYQAFLDETKLYRTSYSVADIGTIYAETQTGCVNADCVDLAELLISNGYNPAILNLASAKKPSGGYRDGLGAQEESLCRSSNLSLSLYQFGDPKYINIRESGVPTKLIAYPLDRSFGGIYSPNVTFFRNNKTKYFTIRDSSFKCDVITVAALSFNGRTDFSNVDETIYRSASGGFTPGGEEIMLNKIRTIFRMGVEHGKDSLILGAFGCGAYRLPSADVARLFRIVMEESEFKNKFRLLVFAILESTRKPNGLDGKFADFYNEFGIYDM